MSKFICMIDGELPAPEPESVPEPSTVDPNSLEGLGLMENYNSPYRAEALGETVPLRIFNTDQQINIPLSINFNDGQQSPVLIVTPEREMRLPMRTAFNDTARFDRDVVFNGDDTIFNGTVHFAGPTSFNGPVFIGNREITSQMLDALENLANGGNR